MVIDEQSHQLSCIFFFVTTKVSLFYYYMYFSKHRYFIFVFFCCFLCLKTQAQLGKNKEGGLVYEKEWSVGAMVHTNGYGLNFEKIKMRKDRNFELLDFNIYSIFHPKEISEPNPDNQGSRPYVYGKLNNLIGINGGYGRRLVLADKWIYNGVKINLNYSLGPLIGMLKPVYYEIESDALGGTNTFERFNPNDERQQSKIVGTDFTKGFDHLSFLYGLHGKSSLSFDWGGSEKHYFSIETGIVIDAFPVEVPIFAYIKNDRVFTNLFVSISIGKRHE